MLPWSHLWWSCEGRWRCARRSSRKLPPLYKLPMMSAIGFAQRWPWVAVVPPQPRFMVLLRIFCLLGQPKVLRFLAALAVIAQAAQPPPVDLTNEPAPAGGQHGRDDHIIAPVPSEPTRIVVDEQETEALWTQLGEANATRRQELLEQFANAQARRSSTGAPAAKVRELGRWTSRSPRRRARSEDMADELFSGVRSRR